MNNKTAVSLLRMALALLDRDGGIAAACDVDRALVRLGVDPGPPSTDADAVALLDWRRARAATRRTGKAPDRKDSR